MSSSDVILFIIYNALIIGYIFFIDFTIKRSPYFGPKWRKFWESVTYDRVKLSIFVMLLAIGVVAIMYIPTRGRNSFESFFDGVFVELTGMLFDVVILVLLFNFMDNRGEKKRTIERLENEIQDFIHWNSEESKYRIRGNLFRLNKEGVTAVKLEYPVPNEKLDLSKLDLNGLDLSGSKLLHVDFTNCKLANANFSHLEPSTGVDFSCPKQPVGKKGGLLNVKFIGVHMQIFDFVNTYLHSADFTDATLSNVSFASATLTLVKFERARFYDVNFGGAEVSKNFLEQFKSWNTKGAVVEGGLIKMPIPNGQNGTIYEYYEVVEEPVRGYIGHFNYFLRRKNPAES